MSNDIQRKIKCLAAFVDEKLFCLNKDLVDLKDDFSEGHLDILHARVSTYEAIKAEMVHLGLVEGVKDE